MLKRLYIEVFKTDQPCNQTRLCRDFKMNLKTNVDKKPDLNWLETLKIDLMTQMNLLVQVPILLVYEMILIIS